MGTQRGELPPVSRGETLQEKPSPRANTVISGSQPPEPGGHNFLSLKSPVLWCFVRPALANQG